ncbi:MAG: TerB family tellurite resistance protein [Bacteroidales bacterium]|jgi:DnaJ like chaperone protein|nr:TerB family tellurite resistance protein [Bacteroidales bacterium]
MGWFFTIIIILILVGYFYSRNDSSAKMKKRRRGGYAKWVGGGLGWAFGGPIGGILGFAFGKMFEDMQTGTYTYPERTLEGDFKISLLVLSAAVMKADGNVRKSELDYVKRFFISNFGQSSAEESILMLREILKQDINIQEVSRQIEQFMDYSSRLQLLHYLFGIAQADGQLPPKEVNTISTIAAYLGIGLSDFDAIKAMFVKDSNSAYKILEIQPEASDTEVKKAYHEMARKFHPDKVNHLGEDVRKAAEAKFKEVTAAYEHIKKERKLV